MYYVRSIFYLSLTVSFLTGCVGYSGPAARGEVTDGVVAQGQPDHGMRVKEQREVISAQEKIMVRQERERMDAKRQKEQNERLERYGSERSLDTFNGY